MATIIKAPVASPVIRSSSVAVAPTPIQRAAVIASSQIRSAAPLSLAVPALRPATRPLPAASTSFVRPGSAAVKSAVINRGLASSGVSQTAIKASEGFTGKVDTGIHPPGSPSEQYDVPYAEADRAYIPPPKEPDLPQQYDLSMYDKPAIRNADISATPIAAVSSVAAIAKPGIIDKILNFFGLSRSKVVKATMAGEAAKLATMSRTEAATSLVRRARNGDQNAMAMLAAVRDRALAGDAQAEVSLRLMHAFIKAHPTDENASPDFGGEASQPEMAAAVTLSHGPTLTQDRITALIAKLTTYEKQAFHHGMKGGTIGEQGHPASVTAAHALGRAVGTARVLQAARMKHIPLGNINANIGWELE